MGLLDFLNGSGSGGEKCEYCGEETEKLPYKKKINDKKHSFCSRECSHNYRLMIRRQKRNPM